MWHQSILLAPQLIGVFKVIRGAPNWAAPVLSLLWTRILASLLDISLQQLNLYKKAMMYPMAHLHVSKA